MVELTVIGYTYDADYHCLACVASEFGPANEYGEYHGLDSEGNRIFPVFSTDEWYANETYQGESKATLACGTCGVIIEELDLAT